MKTVSFHSVKGGVGRTNAVISFSRALKGLGKNVLILELDFDAPGLVHKLNRDNWQTPIPHIPELGYVDYLAHFNTEDIVFGELESKANTEPGSVRRAKIEFLQKIWFCFDQAEVEDASKENQPGIKAIRAGADTESYWWKLSSNWFHELFAVSQNEYSSNGDFLLHANREILVVEQDILSQLEFDNGKKADYLVVDCRSSREYASVPLYYWSDAVVHMFPHNLEGFNSAIRVSDAFYACNIREDPRLFPVVSRVPESKLPGKVRDGFSELVDWGEYVERLNENTQSGFPEKDDIFRLKGNTGSSFETEPLFFIQEAVFATHDERLMTDPRSFNVTAFGPEASSYHRVLCDQARVFHSVISYLEDNGKLPEKSDIEPSNREQEIVRILAYGSAAQHFDLNVSQTNEGQAFNVDGNKNVLLRNASLQTLMSTLERHVRKSIENLAKGEIPTNGSDVLQPFYQSGLEIGLDFGIDAIIKEISSSSTRNVQFPDYMRMWCDFDTNQAAFGLMKFIPGSEGKFEISWLKPFLMEERDLGEGKQPEHQISFSALKFLSGYIVGNSFAYYNYKYVGDALKSHSERLDAISIVRIEFLKDLKTRLKPISVNRVGSGLIENPESNGLSWHAESTLRFSVHFKEPLSYSDEEQSNGVIK